jgi:hypothetical protein
VDWTGSSTASTLNVTTYVGGVLGGTVTLAEDGSPSQNVNYSDPPNSVTGTYTAQFNANGTSGTLMGNLKWTVNGQSNSFSGTIATWDCGTS